MPKIKQISSGMRIGLCACICIALVFVFFMASTLKTSPEQASREGVESGEIDRIIKFEEINKNWEVRTSEDGEDETTADMYRLVASSMANGLTEADAIKEGGEYIIRRDAIYMQAEKDGYGMPAKKAIELTKKQYEYAKEADNYNELLISVEESGLSLDEYIERDAKMYRKGMAVDYYVDAKYQEHLKGKNIVVPTNADYDNWKKAWDAEVDELIKNFLDTGEGKAVKKAIEEFKL